MKPEHLRRSYYMRRTTGRKPHLTDWIRPRRLMATMDGPSVTPSVRHPCAEGPPGSAHLARTRGSRYGYDDLIRLI